MASRDRIIELLNGGDWACAYKERKGLADVCGMLAPLVEPELAARAELIARAASKDMRFATKQWAELATRLRRGRHSASAAGVGRGKVVGEVVGEVVVEMARVPLG